MPPSQDKDTAVQRVSGMALAVALAFTPGVLLAQDLPSQASSAKPKLPQRALRLSDWLLTRQASDEDYPLGLSLRFMEEVPAQNALKLGLLESLAGADKAKPEATKRLNDFLATLPATGRVPVANTDGRWLQVNRTRDPVLRPGYSVVLPRRPRAVTVINEEGAPCHVVHKAGFEAKSYVEACRRAGAGGADWAWIAQPDGRVQRFGVALWNEQKQDEPAAGAWIWAPARGSGWSEGFSERLIQFLATQGPAPDAPAYGTAAAEQDAASASPDPPGGQAEGLKLSEALSMPADRERPKREDPAIPTPLALRSDERPSRSRDHEVSSSDWGGVGLLQTPTARMREASSFSFGYTRTQPYTHLNFFFQPFDWMEAGFRYTEVSNRLYGPVEFSGTQTYKDKSIDVKFRAWKETAYLPEVAVGLRDVGGTGLFAGEYVVANKRTGDLDWSLGLGWGYVGARGDVRNPLSALSDRFDTRAGTTVQGGDFSVSRYFRGPTALFGGVQYRTPWDRLTLKLEYEGNDYQHEPQGNNQRQSTPFNFGLVYRATSAINVSLGVERGNTVMLAVSLHSQLNKLTQTKIADPPLLPVALARPSKEPDWSITSRDLERQTYWQVRSIERKDNEVRIVVDDADATYWRSRVDRVASVLHRDAPQGIEKFTVTYLQRGIDVAEHVIDREAWVNQRTQPVPPSERREAIIARPPEESRSGDVVHTDQRHFFTHGMSLGFAQILGGPDAFSLFQVYARESARLQLRDDTWLQGSLHLRLFDNYDKFKFTAPSNLPRVRTFQREFVTTSRLTIPNLQLSHVGKLGENHFYSVYGGLLEDMYGGVGGEWLYRPFASRVAVGVDVNAVQQRDFHQNFEFRDYRVVTGHANLYWDTGWQDVIAKVSAGRYLARDIGATLQLSRIFKNGVIVGAFATKTNVSAAEFGEGSFDKGLFLSIPFDTVYFRSTGTSANFLWRPLTRDGGAMLSRYTQLYNLTRLRDNRTLQFEAAPLPNEMLIPPDRREEWTPQKPAAEPYTRVTPKAPPAEWERPGSMREHELVEALYKQNFRNIKVEYDPSQRVLITASNDQLHPISRAVGRAARTALLQAPVEARGISVTFMDGPTQQVRYEFFDLDRLRRYFDGQLNVAELKDYVKVQWLNPAARERDPFARLDDLDPDAKPRILASILPDTLSISRVANDVAGAASNTTKVDWLGASAIGAGLVLASSVLDNRAFRFAQDHSAARWSTQGIKIGDAIPWVGFAAAGALALDGSDPRRSRTGYAAVEAGATAFVMATGLKYAVGRARPTSGLGKKEFNWLTSDDAYASFPSRHTAVAWALATPFALEYDMPWLYGVAALTNLSRVGSREHWLSDTVASSAIGYGLGRLFWQSGRDQAKGEPKVFFDGSGLGMLWGW